MQAKNIKVPEFAGFPKAAIGFLQDLAANNNRAWFTENRTVYKSALEEPGKDFRTAMETELTQRFGVPFEGRIFRLHRDLRFSKDKTPYNTHLRMAFFPKAGASDGAGFFFSLEPQRLVLGGGVMSFSKAALAAYRQKVAEDESGAQIEESIAALVASGFRLDAPELKRIPPGIEKDHPRELLLRRKSLTLWQDLRNHRPITESGAVAFCADVFTQLQSLCELLESFAANEQFT